MYKFDKDTKTLHMSKAPIKYEFNGYTPNDHRKAYLHYLYSYNGIDEAHRFVPDRIDEDKYVASKWSVPGDCEQSARDDIRPTLRKDLNTLCHKMTEIYRKRNTGVEYVFKIRVTNIRENDSNYPREGSQGWTTVYGDIYLFERGSYESGGSAIRIIKNVLLLALPYVDRFGVLNFGNLRYGIVASSDPSRFITKEKDELNIMLNANKVGIRCITKINKSSMQYGKVNDKPLEILLFNLLVKIHRYLTNDIPGLIDIEGYNDSFELLNNVYTQDKADIRGLFEGIELSSFVLFKEQGKVRGDYEGAWRYGIDSKDKDMTSQNVENLFGVLGYTKVGDSEISKYALGPVREQLNEMLSISRGLSRVLSRDVYDSKGRLVAKANTAVTKDVLQEFNDKFINLYYVKNQIVSTKLQLAVDVAVTFIPAGTFIHREIIEQNKALFDAGIIKVDSNQCADKDYEFKYQIVNGIVVPDTYNSDDTQFEQPTSIPFVVKARTILSSDIIYFLQSVSLYDKWIIRTSRLCVMQDGVESAIITNNRIPYLIKNDTDLSKTEKFNVTNVSYLMLEEEILGNQHFQVNSTWKYVSSTTGEIAEPSPFLTIFDILVLFSLSQRFADGKYLGLVVDRDYGMRKMYKVFDDHFSKVFNDTSKGRIKGLVNAIIADTADENKVKESVLKCVMGISRACKDTLFSDKCKVLSILDITNPPASVSASNKVNTITASSKSVGDKMRSISLNYANRICVFETPASAKLGVVNTKAKYAEISGGTIWAEYYKVYHEGNRSRIDFSIRYRLQAVDDESYTITTLEQLKFDSNGNILNTNRVKARVPAYDSIEKSTIEDVYVDAIDYVNCEYDQILSPVAACIPYIGSDDATRVTYGLSMAKQTRPLVYRELPYVITPGFYDIVRVNDIYSIFAEDDGIVLDAFTNSRDDGEKAGSRSHNRRVKCTIHVLYNHDVYTYSNCANPNMPRQVTYTFYATEYSHYSVIHRKMEVSAGQQIKKGQMLMSSNYTVDGMYASGINMLTAVIPLDGTNYEDGVALTQSCCERLTSYGHGSFKEKYRLANVSHRFPYTHYIDANYDTVVRTINSVTGKRADVTSPSIRGFLVEVKTLKTDAGAKKSYSTREFHMISLNVMGIGDKMANRHGNKGECTIVISDENALQLPNGLPVECYNNPCGIPSRMNPGQIKEMHIGLACKVLGIRVSVQAYNEEDWISHDSKLLLYAWYCANEGVAAANAMSEFSSLPRELKDYELTREKEVSYWKDVFDKDGTAYLYDPVNRTWTNTPVLIGYIYVNKLVQELDDKFNARAGIHSDSNYVRKHARPTKGINQGGGQTYGEMEAASLAAYGTVNYLHELQHQRGDNPYLRQKNQLEMYDTYDDDVYELIDGLETNNERRSVEHLRAILATLGCEFEVVDPVESCGLTNIDSSNTEKKYLISPNTVNSVIYEFKEDKVEYSPKTPSNKLKGLVE